MYNIYIKKNIVTQNVNLFLSIKKIINY